MKSTTTLSKSPAPSFYLDGMKLGDGIDAITGEISKSALDPSFHVRDAPSSQSGDHFSFRSIDDVTELSHSVTANFTASVTAPVEGINIGVSSAFDFTHNEQSTASVSFILFEWTRKGDAKEVTGAKLSDKALVKLRKHRAHFRDAYGDYYIHRLSYTTKFTAVWKCTAETSSNLTEFKQDISGSLNVSEMEAGGSFTTKLSTAAKKHQVSLDVQYDTVGNAGGTQYDQGDVLKTFNSFRAVAKPVPYEVFLRHYRTIDDQVPVTIDMDPDVFERVCNVFASTQFVLFLIGIVPGTRSVRLSRHDKLDKITRKIYANRIAFQDDPNALDDAIQELGEMRDMLWLRLERQDLVLEMYSTLYQDLKRKFVVDHENKLGAWVRSSQNVGSYALGRVNFNDQEKKKYAVLCETNVAEVHVNSVFLQQQFGALEFPGTSGINGYVVGLVVESCWKDGTNGWWCVDKDLRLGRKQAKVEVKTEGSRGMHWRLNAYYIPSSEYDE